MISPAILLLIVSAAPEAPSIRGGPTAALFGALGGGDAGFFGSVGARVGARVIFGDSFGAAGCLGYEREVTLRDAHHLLVASLRGELVKALGSSLAWVEWALYLHVGGLVSLDDDLSPGPGGGLRAGVGFTGLEKIPLLLEVGFQRQWLASGAISAGYVQLGLGF